MDKEHIYKCKQCRAALFRKLVHGEGDCTSYFIDRPAWINTDGMNNQTKLNCPKCHCKMGEIIFSGKMCSCQEWVSPAFQVHKNKVDKCKLDIMKE